MSGGYFLLILKKVDVIRVVFYNVISKVDQYGKLSGENFQGVFLNVFVLLSLYDKD